MFPKQEKKEKKKQHHDEINMSSNWKTPASQREFPKWTTYSSIIHHECAVILTLLSC
jgi:hypothetical protein